MMFANQTTHRYEQGGKTEGRSSEALESWEIESVEALNFMRIATTDNNAGLDRVITVASISTVVRKFLTGGGSVVRPELSIPGIGKMISCRDKIGQVFTFLEEENPVCPERISFGRK